MPEFEVILVEPKYAGNIGAVARAMMNFDVTRLTVVSPVPSLDDQECRDRAVHAQTVLDAARLVDTFHDASTQVDYLVGTSAISSKTDRRHLRKAMTLEAFTEKIFEIEGRVGIAFGREDYGLLNTEIAQCDLLVKIPSSASYGSLNLSHAVAVVLYMLFSAHREVQEVRRIGKIDMERLASSFQLLLDLIHYPQHKKKKTEMLFRRIVGRAMLSTLEYHTIMGVIKGVLNRIRRHNGNTP